MNFRFSAFRERGGFLSLCGWLLLLGAVVLAATSSASASSLAGDLFVIKLLCSNNPTVCPASTSSTVLNGGSPFLVPNNTGGFTFNTSFTSGFVHGTFTNEPQQLDIEFSWVQGFTTFSNVPGGGFLGVTIQATDPSSNPVQVLFDGTAGTTNGFTLANNVSYGPSPDLIAQLNFAGLTGSCTSLNYGTAGCLNSSQNNDTAVLQLPSAAVPEPGTWLLLASGLLGLGIGGKRRAGARR